MVEPIPGYRATGSVRGGSVTAGSEGALLRVSRPDHAGSGVGVSGAGPITIRCASPIRRMRPRKTGGGSRSSRCSAIAELSANSSALASTTIRSRPAGHSRRERRLERWHRSGVELTGDADRDGPVAVDRHVVAHTHSRRRQSVRLAGESVMWFRSPVRGRSRGWRTTDQHSRPAAMTRTPAWSAAACSSQIKQTSMCAGRCPNLVLIRLAGRQDCSHCSGCGWRVGSCTWCSRRTPACMACLTSACISRSSADRLGASRCGAH